MSTTGDTNQTPDDGAGAGRSHTRWKKSRVWLGGVLTTAIVIPLVAWAAGWTGHWFTSKVSPEEYLSAVVDIPSPAGRCNGWVFDKDPQHLPGVLPDDDLDDLDAWAAANGGIPASGNDVVVTLQGLNGHTVVVNSITVDVVSRTEPPHGTYPKTLLPCGGPLVPYRFQADLDATPVSVTAVADDPAVAEGQARRPVDLPHAISGSEPEVWYLAAVTNTCTCEWTATLNWTSEGNEGHTPITDNGHPLRVAAVTRATHVDTDFNGRWVILPK
jgi:hypothetical protein